MVETDPEADPTPFERWVLPYIEDSTLWPVLIVVLGHLVAFVAPVILMAVRDRWFPAIGALTGLLLLTTFATIEEVRGRGRPGAQTAILAVAWTLCAGGAFVADHYGVF